MESPGINLYVCGQLLYNKGDKKNNGERKISSVKGIGETGKPHAKE